MTTIPESHYNGEILTDITSFAIVQTLFDKPEEVNLFQLMDLESLIESLLFHEKILIVGPTRFGYDFEVKTPQILEDLIEKDVVEVYSPEFCSGVKDFSTLFDEMRNLIYPERIETLYSSNKEIENDLKIYDAYFGFSKQVGSLQLAKQVGVINEPAISLCAHLVRTNVHIKSLHEIEKKSDRKISYSPHMARVSLLNEICNLYESKRLPIARKIIERAELSERQRREALNQTYGSRLELDIPILTTRILSQCRKVPDILDEVLTLRKNSKVRKYRNWCNKFQEAIYSDDRKNIEKYDKQLEAISSEVFERASKVHLRSIPQMDLSLGEDNIALGVLQLISAGYNHLMKYLRRRDIIFLIDLKNRLKNIKHSKDEFEKVFKVKLKI